MKEILLTRDWKTVSSHINGSLPRPSHFHSFPFYHHHPMTYCDRCDRWFRDNRALERHEQDSNSHWICDDCGLDFPTFTGLDQHYIQSPKHHYCRECETHYPSEGLRLQHMEDDHWYCRQHDKASDPVIDFVRLLRPISTRIVGLQIQSRPPIPLLTEPGPPCLPRLRLHEGQYHLFGLAYIPFSFSARISLRFELILSRSHSRLTQSSKSTIVSCTFGAPTATVLSRASLTSATTSTQGCTDRPTCAAPAAAAANRSSHTPRSFYTLSRAPVRPA